MYFQYVERIYNFNVVLRRLSHTIRSEPQALKPHVLPSHSRVSSMSNYILSGLGLPLVYCLFK